MNDLNDSVNSLLEIERANQERLQIEQQRLLQIQIAEEERRRMEELLRQQNQS